MVYAPDFRRRLDFGRWLEPLTVVLAKSISVNHELIVMTGTQATSELIRGRTKQGPVEFWNTRTAEPYQATLWRFGEEGLLRCVQVSGLELALPQISSLPHEGFVIVGSRCRGGSQPEKNAVTVDRKGEIQGEFTFGDGIKDLQADSEGGVWVSYFDEGIFGNYGWTDPIGSSGLVRFCSKTGKILHEFIPPKELDRIDDCYSLNVSAEAVTTCYSSEFAVVRMNRDGSGLRSWENIDHLYQSEIVAGETRAMLVGGYKKEHLGTLLDLKLGETHPVAEFQLKPPEFEGRYFARGSTLHYLTDADWWSLEMPETS